MSDALPVVPPGRVFILRRETVAKVLAEVSRMTPKAASQWIDFGDRGHLSLRDRKAADGTTVRLALVPPSEDGAEPFPAPSGGSGGPNAPSESVPIPQPPPDSSGTGEGSGGTGGGSGAGSGTGTESSSSGPPGSGSGSSKASMAIVPAAGRWIAWVVRESPEAKFEERFYVATDAAGRGEMTLPADWLESCEEGSIRAVEATPDGPGAATARVVDGVLQVETWAAAGALVAVEGTRRGHAGRWAEYSPGEALANDWFYQIAESLTLL